MADLRDTLIVLPAVERFDGTGGAVSTWVSEVCRAQESGLDNRARILAPRATSQFADGLDVLVPRTYSFFDRCQENAAKIAAKLRGRSWWTVYTHMLHTFPLWKKAVHRVIRKGSYRTIIVHNRPEYFLGLHDTSAQLVLHMHNDLADYVTEPQVDWLIDRGVHFIFCSDYVRQSALRDFPQLPTDRCHVIYNGVRLPKTVESDSACRASAARAAYAGRLIEEKGPDTAILGCAHFLRTASSDTNHLRLSLFGGTHSGAVDPQTPFRMRLAELATAANTEFGDDTVTLEGPVPQDRLLSSLSHADFFLYPCRWNEPFGMVIIEAMSRGCVPIASDRGGIPEIISSNESGILLPAAPCPEDVSGAIRQLLEDDALVSKLRAGAIRRASKFSWPNIARDTMSVLSTIDSPRLEEVPCQRNNR